MEQATGAHYKITASPEFREVERLREKARHDGAQALYHAKMAGHAEGRARLRRPLKNSKADTSRFVVIKNIKHLSTAGDFIFRLYQIF